MQTYREEHIVQWHEIDAAMNLRYYAFMNLAGEAANRHADTLGFGYDDLIGENQVWVMSRVHIKFNRAPKWREKLTFETWHKGRSGLFWLRDFEMRDANGDVAVCATTSWVVMNFATRRIERKAAFESKPSVVESSYNRDAITEPCDKIVPPTAGATSAGAGASGASGSTAGAASAGAVAAGAVSTSGAATAGAVASGAASAGAGSTSGAPLTLLREHTVKYSDIDFNLHANNAKYFEWVMDSLPMEILKNSMVVDFKLNFITEARYGDTIQIFWGEKESTPGCGKCYYLQGERSGGLIFQAEIILGDRV